LGREILKNRNLFKRSIILVAFDGEESGLNGSKWMVKDSLIEPSQIKLMISIDMIGMLSKAEGIELLGMGTLKNGNLMANQVAAKNQLKIKKSTKNLQSRTDTKPFGDIGIPAIHITTGTISPYHKPEDDANLLDYEGMAQITEFTFNLAQKLAAEESTQLISAIATKDGKPKTKIFKPGVRFNMGSSWHKYPAEFYNGKDGFAIQTGLYTHINLVSRFSLQPEVLYETMGSDNTDGKFRTHAITTPVNILISFAGNKDFETWSYFVLGAYYTYNFAGKKGSHNIDFEDTFDPYEYGLNAGFVINMSKIQIGITRKIGLSNLYRDKKNGTIQNSAILGTLGFNF
jgi:aminopeptidase YwaD